MNRNVLTLLVVSMVALAGCTGGLGGVADGGAGSSDGSDGGAGSSDGGSGDGGDSGESGDGASGSDGDGSSGGSVPDGEWEPFAFDRPAKYVFEMYTAEDGTGRLVWDVQAVDGDQITVRTLYELGDERYESTVTGDRDTIQGQLFTNPGGVVLFTAMITPGAWYTDRDLSPGTKWAYSTPRGSASFSVTGVDNYAGVDCHATEMRVNSTVIHSGCFTPELGLAPYAAYFGEDGTKEFELKLIEYTEQ